MSDEIPNPNGLPIRSFKDFMENTPPSSAVIVTDSVRVKKNEYAQETLYGKFDELELYCSDKKCSGVRVFRCTNSTIDTLSIVAKRFGYVTYTCSNCNNSSKTFSVVIQAIDGSLSEMYKFGEFPVFGPHIPSKVSTLIGPDRDMFFKGRRCESQGLGVGAFVYYRRVIESQKARIFDEIIKVANTISPGDAIVAELEQAKNETQFSKAISKIRTALPQVLLINGQNPLSLLHTALSDGLHDQTDEHCLELASSIRIVLAELADRMAQAIKDNQELSTAVKRLMTVKQAKS